MKKIINILLFLISVNIFSLDLNNASLNELLNGTNMDMLDAMKIMDYRKNNKIDSLEQLVEDKIISFDTMQRIKKGISSKESKKETYDYRIKNIYNNNVSRTPGNAIENEYQEGDLFKKILEKMESKDYKIAGKYIKLFMKDYKDSVYTDDVIYFAGAIYEEDLQYKNAIKVYNRIVENFYTYDITVIALYRMSICYEKIEDYYQAKKNYRRITSEFTGTVWAEKARKRLDELQ